MIKNGTEINGKLYKEYYLMASKRLYLYFTSRKLYIITLSSLVIFNIFDSNIKYILLVFLIITNFLPLVFVILSLFSFLSKKKICEYIFYDDYFTIISYKNNFEENTDAKYEDIIYINETKNLYNFHLKNNKDYFINKKSFICERELWDIKVFPKIKDKVIKNFFDKF